MKQEIKFKFEKDTKNTLRYFAINAAGNPLANAAITTVYVNKSHMPQAPETIKIILET